jgi:hypothetical protein
VLGSYEKFLCQFRPVFLRLLGYQIVFNVNCENIQPYVPYIQSCKSMQI